MVKNLFKIINNEKEAQRIALIIESKVVSLCKKTLKKKRRKNNGINK